MYYLLMGGILRSAVVISGSYRKFPEELSQVMEEFRDLGVSVLSPQSSHILSSIDGFVSLKGDIVERIDTVINSDIVRAMRTVENGHLNAIVQSDALYVVAPQGYCGISTAFEMGWALAHEVPIYYDSKYVSDVQEPILKMYARPVASISSLVNSFDSIPKISPLISRYFLHQVQQTVTTERGMRTDLNVSVAVGSIIVDHSKKYRAEQQRDILLVKTHKWGGKFSIVGGRITIRENIKDAFLRTVQEQTGLESVISGDICSFDRLPNSGYYKPSESRLYVDKSVKVQNRRVTLDHRAQEYIWIPSHNALKELDIEPNARRTIEMYNDLTGAA